MNSEIGLAKQLGSRYMGIETDWVSIEKDILTVKSFLTSFTPAVSQGFLELICDDEELRKEAETALNELRMIRDEASEAYGVFNSYFDKSESIGAVEFGSLIERYNQCLSSVLATPRQKIKKPRVNPCLCGSGRLVHKVESGV